MSERLELRLEHGKVTHSFSRAASTNHDPDLANRDDLPSDDAVAGSLTVEFSLAGFSRVVVGFHDASWRTGSTPLLEPLPLKPDTREPPLLGVEGQLGSVKRRPP
jgi:hypothetical protein